MVFDFRLDRFSSVNGSTMSLAQRLSTAALLVAVAGIGLSPAVQAHGNHHHHSHKKQKAYNKGYRKGYNKAVKQTYRPYYRPYYRTYAPGLRTRTPSRRRCSGALDRTCSSLQLRHPRQRRTRVQSLDRD